MRIKVEILWEHFRALVMAEHAPEPGSAVALLMAEADELEARRRRSILRTPKRPSVHGNWSGSFSRRFRRWGWGRTRRPVGNGPRQRPS